MQKGVNGKNATISIENGDENIGMLASGGSAIVENLGDIKIIDTDAANSDKGNIGMATAAKESFKRNLGSDNAFDGLSRNSDDVMDYDKNNITSQQGYLKNSGTITIDAKSKNNIGILINADITNQNKGTGVLTDTSQIIVNSEGNIGVANYGNLTMAGGSMSVKGAGSVGVYADYAFGNGTGAGASSTTITSSASGANAKIDSSKGAVALYVQNSSPTRAGNSVVNISNTDLTVENGGLLFYNYTNNSSGAPYIATGELNLGSNVNATIKNNGLGFLLKESAAAPNYWQISDVLSNIKGTGLNLKLEDGARLFLIDAGKNATVSATDVANVQTALNSSKVSITNDSGNYRFLTLKGGTFNVDNDIKLESKEVADNPTFKVDYIASNVNINAGKTVSNASSGDGKAIASGDQYIIAQVNPKTIAEGGLATDIKINNNGTIIIKENSANADAVKDTIALVGDLVEINNAGTINNEIDNGVGILGTRSAVINNTGIIKAGKNGTGIYALNTLIPISSNDFTNAEKGNIIINNSGNITAIGNGTTPGYGIVAQNRVADKTSTITVTAGTIDISSNTGGAGVYANNTNVNPAAVNPTANSVININAGTIKAGKEGAAVAHINGITNIAAAAIETTGEKSTGIFQQNGGTVKLNGTNLKIGNKGIGAYAQNANIENNASNITSFGDAAIGYAIENGTFTNSTAGNTPILGNDSVYIYVKGNGATATATNNTPVISTGSGNVALYGNGTANIVNNADINFEKNIQNVGILMTGNGGKAVNNLNKTITVGKSDVIDPLNERYSIGMAAEGTNITLENQGKIVVKGNRSIGMYGSGAGVNVSNIGEIILDASSATDTSRIDGMTGMYVSNGATATNWGRIKTAGNYAGNRYVKGLAGIVIKDATFVNHGEVTIDADKSYGVYIQNGVIKNYGNMTIKGNNTRGIIFDNKNGTASNRTTEGTVVTQVNGNDVNGVNPATGNLGTITASKAYDDNVSYDPSNKLGDVTINGNPKTGLVTGVTIGGVPQVIHDVATNLDAQGKNFYVSNLGIYIDTLGRTNAIKGLENLFATPENPNTSSEGKINIMFGAELADITNEKVIRVPQNIVAQIREAYSGYKFEDSSFVSGAYHWIGSYDQATDTFVMAKLPYTNYAKPKDTNTYNFLDGVEQRYGVNLLGSAEKKYFNKLNSIGDGEAALWTQAVDEAMGRQYINTKQRLYETSRILDNEFDGLRNWRNVSKQANKIITFGTRGEYNTESAQIHNHTNNAYGIAYINERETLKQGESKGWYAGVVHNIFKLRDIGKSEEGTTMLKTGIFKAIPFGTDKTNIFTVSSEIFAGQSKMKRRFVAVDEIFETKGDYFSYGAALKGELAKNIRLSERVTFTPYAGIKVEYGKHKNIKEDKGVLRLNIKSDDYTSIRPETGIALTYKQPMAVRTTFVASVGAAYETELGKINNQDTIFRVADTTADTYKFKGEKDDRSGNAKFDLNLGIENTRFGVTVNAGYDTKGKNVRGGLGLRLMY